MRAPIRRTSGAGDANSNAGNGQVPGLGRDDGALHEKQPSAATAHAYRVSEAMHNLPGLVRHALFTEYKFGARGTRPARNSAG